MGKKKKHPILTGILVLFVLLIVVGALGSKDSKSEPQKAAVPAPAETTEEPLTDTSAQEVAEEHVETPLDEVAEDPVEEPSESESPTDGISPELKAFLESYEAFMDEYCAFMESYDSSDAAALLKYSALMAKYAEFTAKASEWDSREMNDAETLYYIQVMNRVNEKLLKVSAGL